MMKNRLVILDTNCLIQILGIHSKYRFLWSKFISNEYILCISNEILHEYEEILAQKASPLVADMIMKVLARSRNVIRKDPYFRFNLIEEIYVCFQLLLGQPWFVDTHFRSPCLSSRSLCICVLTPPAQEDTIHWI